MKRGVLAFLGLGNAPEHWARVVAAHTQGFGDVRRACNWIEAFTATELRLREGPLFGSSLAALTATIPSSSADVPGDARPRYAAPAPSAQPSWADQGAATGPSVSPSVTPAMGRSAAPNELGPQASPTAMAVGEFPQQASGDLLRRLAGDLAALPDQGPSPRFAFRPSGLRQPGTPSRNSPAPYRGADGEPASRRAWESELAARVWRALQDAASPAYAEARPYQDSAPPPLEHRDTRPWSTTAPPGEGGALASPTTASELRREAIFASVPAAGPPVPAELLARLAGLSGPDGRKMRQDGHGAETSPMATAVRSEEGSAASDGAIGTRAGEALGALAPGTAGGGASKGWGRSALPPAEASRPTMAPPSTRMGPVRDSSDVRPGSLEWPPTWARAGSSIADALPSPDERALAQVPAQGSLLGSPQEVDGQRSQAAEPLAGAAAESRGSPAHGLAPLPPIGPSAAPAAAVTARQEMPSGALPEDDLEVLAAKIKRILDEEARRYGIDV
jgi:hypothetical protein